MDLKSWVQILDEDVWVSLQTNALWKHTYLPLLFPAMSKILRQTELYGLDRAIGLEEGKTLNSKPEVSSSGETVIQWCTIFLLSAHQKVLLILHKPSAL